MQTLLVSVLALLATSIEENFRQVHASPKEERGCEEGAKVRKQMVVNADGTVSQTEYIVCEGGAQVRKQMVVNADGTVNQAEAKEGATLRRQTIVRTLDANADDILTQAENTKKVVDNKLEETEKPVDMPQAPELQVEEHVLEAKRPLLGIGNIGMARKALGIDNRDKADELVVDGTNSEIPEALVETHTFGSRIARQHPTNRRSHELAKSIMDLAQSMFAVGDKTHGIIGLETSSALAAGEMEASTTAAVAVDVSTTGATVTSKPVEPSEVAEENKGGTSFTSVLTLVFALACITGVTCVFLHQWGARSGVQGATTSVRETLQQRRMSHRRSQRHTAESDSAHMENRASRRYGGGERKHLSKHISRDDAEGKGDESRKEQAPTKSRYQRTGTDRRSDGDGISDTAESDVNQKARG